MWLCFPSLSLDLLYLRQGRAFGVVLGGGYTVHVSASRIGLAGDYDGRDIVDGGVQDKMLDV